MTYDFTSNDRRLTEHITPFAEEIARGMGGREIKVNNRRGSYDLQCPTRRRTTPAARSWAVDPSRQRRQPLSAELGPATTCSSWARALFPQNAGYNPTDTVAALAYWSADAIINQYLATPARWCRHEDARSILPVVGGRRSRCHRSGRSAQELAVPRSSAGATSTYCRQLPGCHTDIENDGMPYAGGRGLETPFGVIYTPNLTPDD